MQHWIKNFDELAITENRKLALEIAEAGYDSINTEKVIENSIKIEDNTLIISGEKFDLAKYKKIKVVGFGKCSCEAAFALEKILGDKIERGVVIGLKKVTCDFIESFAGTHPKPSMVNVEVGKKICEMVENSSEDDLIIAIVSGGGSAMLCSSDSECDQGIELYENSIKNKGTISEMNTVRKHISVLKGGGLSKLAYPATVLGLIFSDVPGDKYENVASGPTYKDETTIVDAEKIIEKYNFGKFDLIETPKEDKYFEKVYNFVLVSNKTAVEAMDKKSKELGFVTNIISTELYDEVHDAVEKIFSAKKDNTVVLAAGESAVKVMKEGGMGGRTLHMALTAIDMGMIDDDSVFLPFASDGVDNSDAAGAIADKNTIEKLNKLKINVNDVLNNFDSYPALKHSGDMLLTGPTGANVSDLMILLTKK